VHTRNIPLSDDVDLSVLARGTPGLAGAELANLVNEAALLAARRNKKRVAMEDFEEAKDKVMLGMERNILITDAEKRSTAFHETGHALVAEKLPLVDPIHKMTVIPRGRALGVTHFLPADERFTHNKEYLTQTLASIMGGRAAEEVVFGQITNGAANDIQTATDIARKMVCEWGMSDKLGPIQFGKHEEMIFLGREISQHKDYSEQTAIMIDEEIRSIVEGAHQRALQILRENMDLLHALAEALLEREILDGEEIARIIRGEKLEPPHRDGRAHHDHAPDVGAPRPDVPKPASHPEVPEPGTPPQAA
jgi:cell division protease FtsH